MIIFEDTETIIRGFGIEPNKYHISQLDDFKNTAFSYFFSVGGNSGRNYANIFFNVKNGIRRLCHGRINEIKR